VLPGFRAGEVGSHEVEKRYVHASGSEVWVQVNVTLLRDPNGRPTHLLCQVQDVTERRRAREQLARNAEELRLRSAELERSNADFAQCPYAASHDLSEPVRMVGSYVHLVDRRYGDRLDDDGRELLAYAVEGATRMQTLIDGLLEYARVRTDSGVEGLVDCGQVVSEALDTLDARVAQAGGCLHLGSLPAVPGDATHLDQLFQNLIANAVKFRSSTSPEISIEARPGPEGWHFAVRNNGIGIEPPHRERIFDLFHRLHARSTYSGTGSGLALCKRIVQRHGGRIWVEAAPGGGSSFEFTLGGRANGGG
jgi:light-regulated signal transduction histidine kinase (bacteriophytochrome)